MELIESHNQCPDCLSMEIEVLPLVDSEDEFELYLTCKFNQQPENILDGKIKFGIRGGKLEVSGQNISILAIDSDSQLFSLVKKDNESLQKTQSWHFISNLKPEIIKEKIERIKLANLKIGEKPYYLQATFTAQTADIAVTEIEGLWKHDLSPNKYGVLERKIAIFIEEVNLKPYVSQSLFASTDFSESNNFFHQQEPKFLHQAITKLQKTIEQIYQAQINDLSGLAEIAELNLLTDFAGGNFVGGELSNLQWSGANLESVNFRGANLTDADLSEANLNYAKLSGADLSGAYLEGAQANHANFSSASLALANLIGADLTGSNFSKTNLTNTSFANAQVNDTVFANNIGLSAENKANLEHKGAIFS